MKRVLRVLAVLVVLVALGAGWYVYSKQPTRQGTVTLANLQGSVTVRYDDRGVPHIQAENETDLYRALGYVHAQDRLFQMEIMRRLARGELAEVLGPKVLDTDKLFRSLRIRDRAATYVAQLDMSRRTGRPCKPIWTGSTNIRTATPAPWSSTCWASPSGRLPLRTPSASPGIWPTALPQRFVPSRC